MVAVVQLSFFLKKIEHNVNIAGANFFRFLFAIQSICCTVLSISYFLLPSNINFPHLSQRTYFLGELVFMCNNIFRK